MQSMNKFRATRGRCLHIHDYIRFQEAIDSRWARCAMSRNFVKYFILFDRRCYFHLLLHRRDLPPHFSISFFPLCSNGKKVSAPMIRDRFPLSLPFSPLPAATVPFYHYLRTSFPNARRMHVSHRHTLPTRGFIIVEFPRFSLRHNVVRAFSHYRN